MKPTETKTNMAAYISLLEQQNNRRDSHGCISNSAGHVETILDDYNNTNDDDKQQRQPTFSIPNNPNNHCICHSSRHNCHSPRTCRDPYKSSARSFGTRNCNTGNHLTDVYAHALYVLFGGMLCTTLYTHGDIRAGG